MFLTARISIQPKDTLLVNSKNMQQNLFEGCRQQVAECFIRLHLFTIIVLKPLLFGAVTKGPSAASFICTSFLTTQKSNQSFLTVVGLM